MEAVAAFALACNVLQVAQLGFQAASSFSQTCKSGTTDENADVEARTQHLSKALARLHESLRMQHSPEDAELLQLSQQCAGVAKSLTDKLEPFSQRASRRRDKWRNGLKAVRVKGQVESLATTLLKYQHTLDTKILIGLRSRIDLVSLEHTKILTTLDTELQSFIQQQILLQKDEHELTRATLIQQSNKISEKLEAIKLSQAETVSYQQLLSSLKFPGMNSRKNQIAVAHPETCEWIFSENQARHDSDIGSGDAADEEDDIATGVVDHALPEKDNTIQGDDSVGSQNETRSGLVSSIGIDAVRLSDNTASPQLPVNQRVSETSVSAWLESSPESSVPVKKKQPPPILATDDINDVADADDKDYFLRQIYRPDNFVEWLSKRSDNYWVTGKPGSGKSTLMSFIINHEYTFDYLKEWAAPQPVQVIDAYFWNSGSELQRSFKGMLATLLLQLLEQTDDAMRQNLVHSIPGTKQKTSFDDWSTHQLKCQINTLLSTSEAKFCIFFDGLDEVEVGRSESDDIVVSFVEVISRLENVKCCISSRPLQLFELAFKNCVRLQLERLNYWDIDCFFCDQLQLSIDKLGIPLSADDFETLRLQFNQKADGVFLWAHLALNSILQGLRYQDAFAHLLGRLEALPSELESLYEHMLSLSNKDSYSYQQEAASFVRIVLLLLECDKFDVQLRPNLLQFTLCFDDRFSSATASDFNNDELAMACQMTRTRIITRCVGLLDVRMVYGRERETSYMMLPLPLCLAKERSQQIHLVHRTAKDFLLSSTAGRRVWQRTATNDENLNDAFSRAMVKELSYSIGPATRLWMIRLTDDLDQRQHMWSGDNLSEFVKYVEKVLRQSTIHHLGEDQENWFIRLVDTWNTRKGPSLEESQADPAPLDLLGYLMSTYRYAVIHSLCARQVERMTPEYCFYLLSSAIVLNLTHTDKGHPNEIEIYALLTRHITETQRTHSLRLIAKSDKAQKREALWCSILTPTCLRLLDFERTNRHNDVLENFQHIADRHGPTAVILEIDLDTGSCWYSWLADDSSLILTREFRIIVRLDPWHLVSCYAAFHADTSAPGADDIARWSHEGSSGYLFEIEGIRIADYKHYFRTEAGRWLSCLSSKTFNRTDRADSLLIRTTLFKDSSTMYLMARGEDRFMLKASALKELRGLIEPVNRRSEEVQSTDYLREQGILVDAEHASALREPPPMFSNTGEGGDDSGFGIIRRSTAESLGVDEFYDAETSI